MLQKGFGLWNLVPTHSVLEARGFFQTANGIIWPTRPVVKQSDYFEMNLVISTEKHPDFPFLLGTISMHQ